MPPLLTQTAEITLTFSAAELRQLEAFAALHGVSVAAFVQRAALDAAHISPAKKNPPKSGASWLDETLLETAEKGAAPDLFAPDLFAPIEPRDEPDAKIALVLNSPVPNSPAPKSPATNSTATTRPALKRGVAGEPSSLAKGQGPVWEIRRALGQERVHGLGWTREHLAFVLKLSVVGVRKMEHLGTAPVKSPEARKNLLELAQLLEKPTPAITRYIESGGASPT